jgi:hypothetical protein
VRSPPHCRITANNGAAAPANQVWLGGISNSNVRTQEFHQRGDVRVSKRGDTALDNLSTAT